MATNPNKKCVRTQTVTKRSDRDRRARQADRLARILSVLRLIQSRGRWNAQAIADEIGVTVRTVYRDLQTLEFAGVPWYFDKRRQCYQVRPDYRFAVPNLTADEALGQAVAVAITKSEGLNLSGGAAPTTRKIAASSTEEVAQLLTDAERLVSVMDLKLADHSKHQEIIRTIQFALLNKKQLSGKYETPYEPRTVNLLLHPIRLCLIKAAWYLIARPDDVTEPKSYRATRFKTLRMLDSSADVPDEFDLKVYFGNAWAVYRGSPTYDVEIRFTPDAARLVTETVWHHTQKARKHADGGVTLTFRVDGLEEICNWLMGWAACSQVIQPQELREMLLHKLRLAVEINQAKSSNH